MSDWAEAAAIDSPPASSASGADESSREDRMTHPAEVMETIRWTYQRGQRIDHAQCCFAWEDAVEHPAIRILNRHRVMSISTVRPDGWPQTTVVGYANKGFDIFFLIFRASQKYANIRHDDRISIAVAAEPVELNQLTAVYAGAHAQEITDQRGRDDAWRLLMMRNSNLAGFNIPDPRDATFMHARCKYVSVLDYTQGLGHREQFVVGDQGVPTEADVVQDGWGAPSAADQSSAAPSR
jgi:hypothetical protein